jgi:hypothetical protein
MVATEGGWKTETVERVNTESLSFVRLIYQCVMPMVGDLPWTEEYAGSNPVTLTISNGALETQYVDTRKD